MSSASDVPVPAGPSLAGRFAAAIALTVGFYALALTLAAGLLAIAILPWVAGGPRNLWVTVTAFVLGATILYAIVPRRLRFEAPGLKVTRADQPRLLELVGEEAKAAGEPLPDDVYLTLDANAAVTQVGRRRRVLMVGVPLMHILSERELRGVIAHEFGHYSGGDTRLGPWIYRTRRAIVRTVGHLSSDDLEEAWSQRVVRQPFVWYGNAFLRITAAISRREEFAADACAVRSVGRSAHVAALRRIHAYGPAFDGYWQEEVVPVLQAGRRPPVAEGFERFIAAESVEAAADAELNQQLEETVSNPYASHPSLPERIDAVERLPDGDPDGSPCAIWLLARADAVERQVLDLLLGADAAEFTPVAWEEVGLEVYGERARHLAREFPQVLEGVTIGGLPDAVKAISQSAEAIRGPDDEPEHVANLVATILADGTLLALDGAGWTIAALPAEPLSARRGDDTLVPHAAVYRMRAGDLTAAQWHDEIDPLGIANLELGATVSRAG